MSADNVIHISHNGVLIRVKMEDICVSVVKECGEWESPVISQRNVLFNGFVLSGGRHVPEVIIFDGSVVAL